MAIRKKKRATGRVVWQVYWKNPVTDKQEAKEFEIEKDAVKFNDDVLFRLKHDRASFAPQDDRTPLTLAVLLKKYLTKADMTEGTRKSSFYRVKAIAQHSGDILSAEITRKDLKELENHLRGLGQKQNTVQRTMSIVTAALNWAIDQEMMPDDFLVPRYTCKRGPDEKLQPPTSAEISKIIAQASPHLKRAIIIAWHLGLRVGASELLKVRWEWVDWEENKIFVEAARKNHNVAWRKLDISPSFLTHLKSWHVDDLNNEKLATVPETIIHYRGRPIQTIKHAWKSTLARAGITRRIRPYDLRHAFATQALAGGADIKAVGEIMGHSDASMILRHYQHVIGKQRKEAVNLIPEIELKQ